MAAKDNPFDPDLVRELATMIANTDLTEIEVEKGDLRIRVARTVTTHVTMPMASPAPQAAAPMPAPVLAPPPANDPAGVTKSRSTVSVSHCVRYRTPSRSSARITSGWL